MSMFFWEGGTDEIDAILGTEDPTRVKRDGQVWIDQDRVQVGLRGVCESV